MRTCVAGANLALVLFTASAKRCWSLRLMLGDWLMHWLKLTTVFSKAIARAGLNEREASGKVATARPPNRFAQLRSVSNALVATLQKHWSKRQNWYDLAAYTSEKIGITMCGGSYVVNLFKQKVASQKTIFLLLWHYTTIFFVVDFLNIFTAQIVHSHMYWGKICLHSLADRIKTFTA